MDWFLYDNGLRLERVKSKDFHLQCQFSCIFLLTLKRVVVFSFRICCCQYFLSSTRHEVRTQNFRKTVISCSLIHMYPSRTYKMGNSSFVHVCTFIFRKVCALINLETSFKVFPAFYLIIYIFVGVVSSMAQSFAKIYCFILMVALYFLVQNASYL